MSLSLSAAFSFLDSGTDRAWLVSLYREFLSQWHIHTIHSLRWKQMSVCHSATTSWCLGFNKRSSSSSITPQLTFPRRSETSTASLELTQLFFHYAVLVAGSLWLEQPLMHITNPAAKRGNTLWARTRNPYKQDELHLTASIKKNQQLWFKTEMPVSDCSWGFLQ